ncbi:hypothetical protein Cantr_09252 [Candida viswanathii]|uniref:Uncharacterized protein n=1 Tax=Candida viswanathii TaxID=5486 RepID=A0A367Y8V2_9ASCO|nr:hypothetical protein Cantr_09252 [Candida viswanathii]
MKAAILTLLVSIATSILASGIDNAEFQELVGRADSDSYIEDETDYTVYADMTDLAEDTDYPYETDDVFPTDYEEDTDYAYIETTYTDGYGDIGDQEGYQNYETYTDIEYDSFYPSYSNYYETDYYETDYYETD